MSGATLQQAQSAMVVRLRELGFSQQAQRLLDLLKGTAAPAALEMSPPRNTSAKRHPGIIIGSAMEDLDSIDGFAGLFTDRVPAAWPNVSVMTHEEWLAGVLNHIPERSHWITRDHPDFEASSFEWLGVRENTALFVEGSGTGRSLWGVVPGWLRILTQRMTGPERRAIVTACARVAEFMLALEESVVEDNSNFGDSSRKMGDFLESAVRSGFDEVPHVEPLTPGFSQALILAAHTQMLAALERIVMPNDVLQGDHDDSCVELMSRFITKTWDASIDPARRPLVTINVGHQLDAWWIGE